MPNHPHRAPGRGHLPGHIRDTFCAAIDAFISSDEGEPLPLVSYDIHYRERQISIAEACRLVWNCTDILPSIEFRWLNDSLKEPPVTQTYAAAARALLRELQQAGLVNHEVDIARRRLYDARDAAWRDLEGWIFATDPDPGVSLNATEAEIRNAHRFRWQVTRVNAGCVFEQWQAGKKAPNNSLEELLQRVAAAEAAIPSSET